MLSDIKESKLYQEIKEETQDPVEWRRYIPFLSDRQINKRTIYTRHLKMTGEGLPIRSATIMTIDAVRIRKQQHIYVCILNVDHLGWIRRQ